MEYELARRLDDSGFPYQYRLQIGDTFVTEKNMHFFVYNEETLLEWAYKDCARIPTLSQLIEACGKRFENLTRGNDLYPEQKDKWFCNAVGNEANYHISDFDSEGSTSEIAVANLWLALNPKEI